MAWGHGLVWYFAWGNTPQTCILLRDSVSGLLLLDPFLGGCLPHSEAHLAAAHHQQNWPSPAPLTSLISPLPQKDRLTAAVTFGPNPKLERRWPNSSQYYGLYQTGQC